MHHSMATTVSQRIQAEGAVTCPVQLGEGSRFIVMPDAWCFYTFVAIPLGNVAHAYDDYSADQALFD